MTTYNLQFSIGEPESVYLSSSARIRRVSRKILLERLIGVVLRDQLILSVLDDDSRPMNAGVRTRVPDPGHRVVVIVVAGFAVFAAGVCGLLGWPGALLMAGVVIMLFGAART